MRDPARTARERLLRAERQARAQALARSRADAAAVADGVVETVTLSRRRGAAITEPHAAGGRGPQPYRRQTGLEWLAGKGRIDAGARAAGERYGAAYRRVKLEAAIPSSLDIKPRGGVRPEPSRERLLAQGEGTAAARRKLTEFRLRLSRQPDLVAACDLVCGEEQTPREAAAGDRDAGRIEAVLKVALDLLAARG